MIEKTVRTISEKTTSVEDKIELSQKGIISFAPASGHVFGIPTTIQNPVILHLQPLAADTMTSLTTWYCDLALYKASDVETAFASLSSKVLAAQIGQRIRIDPVSKSLYVAQASMAAGYASDAVLASGTYWKKDVRFENNAKKFLKVVANAGSAAFKTKTQFLAYEVRGYNNN